MLFVLQVAAGVVLAVFIIALFPVIPMAEKIKRIPPWKIAVGIAVVYLLLLGIANK